MIHILYIGINFPNICQPKPLVIDIVQSLMMIELMKLLHQRMYIYSRRLWSTCICGYIWRWIFMEILVWWGLIAVYVLHYYITWTIRNKFPRIWFNIKLLSYISKRCLQGGDTILWRYYISVYIYIYIDIYIYIFPSFVIYIYMWLYMALNIYINIGLVRAYCLVCVTLLH